MRLRNPVKPILNWVRRERLLSCLIVATPVLIGLTGVSPRALPALVDWHTMAALTGLMLLSGAVQWSGMIHYGAVRLLHHVHSERLLATVLCILAAALAAVITNDVALFIVIPLTLALGIIVRLPLARLIVFQTLAVNAGSALSPIGNPQNLFLWQSSGESFVAFTLAMLPLALPFAATLGAGILIAFRNRRLELSALPEKALAVDSWLFWPTLALYPVFLGALELGYGWPATLLLLLLYGCWQRSLLLRIDWALLLLFLLLFTHLGMITQMPLMQTMATEGLRLPGRELTAGILLSQLISNVPATLFLQPFTGDWRLLAWGVNIGGFGLAIGSLANLIALRLAKQPGLIWQFHLWSIPCLLLSSLLTAGILLIVR